MSLGYQIVSIEKPTEDDYAVIFNGVNNFAISQGLNATTGSYFFAIYDHEQNMLGAISGFDNFGPIEIGGLWVSEHLRGHGYGLALFEKAQSWAYSKKSSMMTVFTLKEWPVCAWYQKLGFTIEFERQNHAKGSVGCYLIKYLR